MTMTPNDLTALKAAMNGVTQSFDRLRGFEQPIAGLTSGFDGLDPQDLHKAAAGHAIAAAALAGFVSQLVMRETGQAPDTSAASVGPDRESEEQR
jgi:hypothetical protein